MRALRFILLALAGALAGCFIGAGSFAGKSCQSNNDCPDPYVCAQVRGTGRSCELVHQIEIGGAAAPDYCNDVKKILDRTCVSNCHGADHTGGSSWTFRLDKYTDSMFGGAREKSQRIMFRLSADDMPPPGVANLRPTSAERALIIRWVNGGAVFCNGDAGAAMTDAGPTDAGPTDAGTRDGGDGG